MEKSAKRDLSYEAVYLFLRGVTSLGTLFAFAKSMHFHSLDSEQALTRELTYTCTYIEEQ